MANPEPQPHWVQKVETSSINPLCQYDSARGPQPFGRADLELHLFSNHKYLLLVYVTDNVPCVAYHPPDLPARQGNYHTYTAPYVHDPKQVAVYVCAGHDVRVQFQRYPAITTAAAPSAQPDAQQGAQQDGGGGGESTAGKGDGDGDGTKEND